MNDETPLIYTSKGNLPVASLSYSTQWEDNDDYTQFTETHTLNGEVVKQSVHVRQKRLLDIGATQAAF